MMYIQLKLYHKFIYHNDNNNNNIETNLERFNNIDQKEALANIKN